MIGSDASWVATVRDAEAMRSLGRSVGEAAPDGAVLLLEGPLGAGKTTFAQGVGAGCGVSDPVTSPTYNLILHYEGKRRFTHVDFYRLSESKEMDTLDLEEVLESPGVTCVEWPALLAEEVDVPYAWIRIEFDHRVEGVRRVEVTCYGEEWPDVVPVGEGNEAEDSE